MNWWRRLFRHREPPRELVIAEAKTERIVTQARGATERADRALREIRRLERAPQ